MSHHARIRRANAAGALGAGAGLTAAVLVLASCSAAHPHPGHQHGANAAASPRATAAGKHASSTSSTPTTTSSTSQTAVGTTAPPTGVSTGQLGSTLPVSDSSGTQLDVTLKKVIDPASGANKYSKPAKDNHFAGVKLRIQNKATTTYQNNANNETTIVLSNGKTLYADYNPIAGCGNFDNGQLKLKSGAASTGCVTFQIPKGQNVTLVKYGNTVFPGRTAQWGLP